MKTKKITLLSLLAIMLTAILAAFVPQMISALGLTDAEKEANNKAINAVVAPDELSQSILKDRFVNDETNPWKIATMDGKTVAKAGTSGTLTALPDNILTLNIDAGEGGTVYFDWKFYCPVTRYHFEFQLDGKKQFDNTSTSSGNEIVGLTAGKHTLTWIYYTKISGTGNYAYVSNFKFDRISYDVIAESSDSSKGTVTGSGTYWKGEFAPLMAMPAKNYILSGWKDESGTVVSTEKLYDCKVLGAVKVTAHFTYVDYSFPNETYKSDPNIGWAISQNMTKPTDAYGKYPYLNLSFYSQDDIVWSGIEKTSAYDGLVFDMYSKKIGGVASLKLVVDGPGTIQFDWTTMSVENIGVLKFAVDGIEVQSKSGYDGSVENVMNYLPWERVSYVFGPGTHTLTWNFTQYGSQYPSSDGYARSLLKGVVLLPEGNMTVAAEPNDTTLGTVKINGQEKNVISTAPASNVALEAIPSGNNVFGGWYDEFGKLVSKSSVYSHNVLRNISLTALFLPFPDSIILTSPDSVNPISVGKDGATLSYRFKGNNAEIFRLAVDTFSNPGLIVSLKAGDRILASDANGFVLTENIYNAEDLFLSIVTSGGASFEIPIVIQIEEDNRFDFYENKNNVTITNDTANPWVTESINGEFTIRPTAPISIGTLSYIETTFTGKGTLSFDWAISCYMNIYLEYFIDGGTSSIAQISSGEIKNPNGLSNWKTITYTFETGDAHTVRWQYRIQTLFDNPGYTNRGYLANIRFDPAGATASLTASANSELGSAEIVTSANPDGSYNVGQTVTLHAQRYDEYKDAAFVYWLEDGKFLSEDPNFVYTVKKNAVLTACFEMVGLPDLILSVKDRPSKMLTMEGDSVIWNYTDNKIDEDVVKLACNLANFPNLIVTATLNGKEIRFFDGKFTLKESDLTKARMNSLILTVRNLKGYEYQITVEIECKIDESVFGIPIENDPLNPWQVVTRSGEMTYMFDFAGMGKLNSELRYTLRGPGVFSFKWDTSGQSLDRFRAYLRDDTDTETRIAQINSYSDNKEFNSMGFRTVSHSLTDDREYTFIWRMELGDVSHVSGSPIFRCWVTGFQLEAGEKNLTFNFNSDLGTVSENSGSFAYNSILNLKAIPKLNCYFIGWVETVEGVAKFLGSDPSLRYQVLKDAEINARFVSSGGDGSASEKPFAIDEFLNYAATYGYLDATYTVYNRGGLGTFFLQSVLYRDIVSVNGSTAVGSGNFQIPLLPQKTTEIKIVLREGGKEYTITLLVIGTGLADSTLTEGYGTFEEPFLIGKAEQLKDMSKKLDAFYRLTADIQLSGTWNPIGTSVAPFTGGLDGAGYTVSGLNLSGGNNQGLFGVLRGAKIKDIVIDGATLSGGTNVGALAGTVEGGSIDNVKITGRTQISASGAAGGLVGYASGAAVKNILIENVEITSKGGNIGGVVGNAVSSNFTDVTVSGSVTGNNNVGGLSGNGGDFTRAKTYVAASGALCVGGFIGGYQTSAILIDCKMAGSSTYTGGHSNNYPYWGTFHGYGAWVTFGYEQAGLDLRGSFASNQNVSKVTVFNSNHAPQGLEAAFTQSGGLVSFSAFVKVSEGTASLDLLSETLENGITGNYGGYVVRFTMADGTYKYASTLDKNTSTLRSELSGNLDEMTSYVDNFADLSIEQTSGFKQLNYNNRKVTVWGTVTVDNANDFEHLSWIINGGIPVTIGGCYYNMRSSATLSVALGADIDLTAERRAQANGSEIILNRAGGVSEGRLLNDFRGIGVNDMMPFRGSLNGNGHKLKVHLDFERGYAVGVINVANELDVQVVIRDLTVEGRIAGFERVGIVGLANFYAASGTLKFQNVTNRASVEAYGSSAGGLVGLAQATTVTVENCSNYGTVKAVDFASGMVGKSNSAEGGFGAYKSNAVFAGTNRNYGGVTVSGAKGVMNYFCLVTGDVSFETGAKNEVYYTLSTGKGGTSVQIKGEESARIADADGNVMLLAATVTDVEGLKNIVLPTGYTLIDSKLVDQEIQVSANTSLLSSVKLVDSIVLYEGNVYDTASSSNAWTLKAVVTYTDGSTEEILLNAALPENSDNQLVFEDMTLTADCNFDLSNLPKKTLSRITSSLEDYVRKYADFAGKSGESNFAALAKEVNAALTGLESVYSDNSKSSQRFRNYVSNQIVNAIQMDTGRIALGGWLSKIVDEQETVFDNSSVTKIYGDYGFSKNLTVKFLSGETADYTLNFVYTKSDLSGGMTISVKSSNPYEISKENYVFVFDPSVSLTVERKEAAISVDSGTAIYNGNALTVGARATNLEAGDAVGLTLSYNGETEAILPGTYEVGVSALTGDDSKYYKLPEGYAKGSFVVSKLGIHLENPELKTFVYSGEGQTPAISVVLDDPNFEYLIASGDYRIVYKQGETLLGGLPKNAGIYSIAVESANAGISAVGSYFFDITPKRVTVTADGVHTTYGGSEAAMTYACDGLVGEDTVSGALARSPGADVGRYAINLGTLTAGSNYELVLDPAGGSYVIDPAPVTIRIGNAESVYGQPADLSKVTAEVVSGEFAANALALVFEKAAGTDVGVYAITLKHFGSNFLVTVEKDGVYTIRTNKVSASFEFPAGGYLYNGADHRPVVTVVSEVKTSDSFYTLEYLSGESLVSGDLKNAGTYTVRVALASGNYEFATANSAAFEINPAPLTVKAQDKNWSLGQKDFEPSAAAVGLAEGDTLASLGTLRFQILSADGTVLSLSDLTLGSYRIKVAFETAAASALNYTVTFQEGALTVNDSVIRFTASVTDFVYSGSAVSFAAKLCDTDGIEISADLFYSYTDKDGNTFDGLPTSAGDYTVNVRFEGNETYGSYTESFRVSVAKNRITVSANGLVSTYDGTDRRPVPALTAQNSVKLPDYTVKYFDGKGLEIAGNIVDVGAYKFAVGISDENFTLSAAEFEFCVETLTVEVRAEHNAFVYRGTALAESELGLDFGNAPATNRYTLGTLPTDAGAYDVSIVSDNPNIAYANAAIRLTVTPAKITGIEFAGKTVVYDGASHSLAVGSLELPFGGTATVNYLNNGKTDAGTYTVTAAISDKNYDALTLTAELKINPFEYTPELTSGSFVYDGTAQGIGLAQATPDFVTGNLTLVYRSGSETLSGKPVHAGSYVLEVSAKNGNVSIGGVSSANFAIAKREIGVTISATNFTYDKSTKKPTAALAAPILGDSLSLVTGYNFPEGMPEAQRFVYAGNYTMSLSLAGLSASDYALPEGMDTVAFTIEKLSVTVAAANTSFVYDGTALTADRFGLSFGTELVGKNYSFAFLPTDAGEYELEIVSTDSNIVFTSDRISVAIAKAKITGIRFADKTVTYDGSAHSLAVDSLELPYGGTAKVIYQNNGKTEGGSYAVEAALDGGKNYEILTLNAQLTVEAYEFDPEFPTANLVYDGTAKSAAPVNPDYSADFVRRNLTLTYLQGQTQLSESPVHAGDYRAVLATSNEKNVKLKGETEFAFTIAKRKLAVSAEDLTVTYSGSAAVYDRASLSNGIAADGLGLKVLYNGLETPVKNAGTYSVTFTLTGENLSDYDFPAQTVALTINQKTVAVTPDAVSAVYGTAPELTYTHGALFGSDTFTGVLSRVPGNAAGEYEILIGTLSAGDNYRINFTTEVLCTVTPKAITVSFAETRFTFNGTVKTPAFTVNGLVYEDTAAGTVRLNFAGDRTNAGTFTATPELLSGNYTLEISASTFTIGKADASEEILGLFNSKATYDGTAKEPAVDGGDYAYVLGYYLGSQKVDSMIGAGTYAVRVEIEDRNHFGSKQFRFVIDKAAKTPPALGAAKVYGNKIVMPEGFEYKLGNGAWQTESTLAGLTDETLYAVTVRIPESANYLEYVYPVQNFKTKLSAGSYNKLVDDLGGFEFGKISQFKTAYSDRNRVSEYETAEIAASVQKLISAFDGYRSEVAAEANSAEANAKRLLFNVPLAITALTAFAFVALSAKFRY